jgi:cell wall-associated NlpC family hydrolase
VKKQFLVVTSPVANLRKEPIEASAEYICDDLQETQLLYNECLLYKEEKEGWYFVEAVEQKKATSHGSWQGYPGWIQKTSATFIDTLPALNAVVKQTEAILLKDPLKKAESLLTLSIGTKLTIEDETNDAYYKTTLIDGQQGWIKKEDINIAAPILDTQRLRKNIIESAEMFLGIPYLWGGRSAHVPVREQVAGIGMQGSRSKVRGSRIENEERPPATTPEDRRGKGEASASNLLPFTFNLGPFTADGAARGVDCSSLTNLAYRVNWVDIPRDAHDQWWVSTHITYDTLAPADLIFISAEEAHDKIIHVMMYLTGEEFIEALETGSVVFINTFKNKFGLTLYEAAKQDFVINKRRIYFGSILIAGEKT